jgi:hypothetical protein
MTAPRLTGDLPLVHPDGRPARLGQFTTEGLLVVQLVQYFGCLPCQDWLIGLDRSTGALADLGASALAVGGSADYQARWLAIGGCDA